MRIQRSWGLCMLTIIAVVIGLHEARAQSYPYPGSAPAGAGYPAMQPPMQPGAPGMVPGGAITPQYGPMMPGGMMQDMRVPAGPMMGPGPAYGTQPASYYDPSQGAPPQQLAPSPAMPMGDPAMGSMGAPPMDDYSMDSENPCPFCGGYGCEVCMSNDFDMRLLRWLLPYAGGGCGFQRWYDVEASWVTLKRDTIGESEVFTTDGISGVPVLGTDQLTFSDHSGFRVSFAIQLGAGNSLETSYLGGFNWNSQASVTSGTNNLFSIYSDFGIEPPPFGFAETDRSSYQSLSYASTLDSIQLNYRQRWVSPNVRFQGSWLGGIRYLYMKEDFQYITASALNTAASDTMVSAMNSLTGAQVGGDAWLCIMPGLRVGAEGTVGLYGNHASQRTLITTLAQPVGYSEKITEDSAAFVGDLNLSMLWRINQNWTFRAGYMFLWMSEVALASNNFNANVPLAGFGQPREAFIENSSDVMYHGFNCGFEYMW